MNLFSSTILTMSLPRTPGMSQPGAEFMLPFIGIALLCLMVGFYFANRRQQWLQQSAMVEGIIVDVFKKYNRDDKMGNYPLHFPQVKFNVGNHQFLALGEEGTNSPLQVGSKIPVRYNVGNPEEATLGTEDAPGIQPKVFYIGAALFFMIGVLFAL